MNIYCFTFGQNHYDGILKDYWVEVIANSIEEAKNIMKEKYEIYSMCYKKEEFEPQYFPKGCLKKL